MSKRSSEILSRALLLLCLGACSSTPPAAVVRSGEAAVVVKRGETPFVVKERTAKEFAKALDAMRSERYSDAERLFTELTVDEPKLSGPWANLGVIHRQRGEVDAAEAAFKRAVELNPKNCDALNELGVIARQRGDFLTAEASYLQCIKVAPQGAGAYLNLGILYEVYLGRFTDALDAYRTFQTLSVVPDERVQGWVSDLERRLIAGRQS